MRIRVSLEKQELCQFCDEPYDNYVISEYASSVINPTDKRLCCNCCAKLLKQHGLSNIAIRFVSGPFRILE
ncbi:hypothetical protein pEaSNUABM14_00132 [Erwinia phage pEa_SNUABM_14]|uniref:Uncharacterized protein n=1 Tax=Erwinia phage pEa_SNUABM_7 TaxID=2866695 RepID=A0AAE7WSD5_9CAUD|nr:hypothetical protein MPK74_gp133 [Erwinia phage pEa_SNUABM_7]QYW03092.1 hypothetical protein pEaSNUABM13_00133 [Erwinia phage pEa_SNUABM_13]QYW03433.1 hypothetical protein pEaSNUABM34_00131 [Erwinia phage pEa_SNUABM_34]QYW03775.1 hypothetical protein pEaSNUABM45_00132 [Erwinia phage pEa_SNUABM_45]QYW04116.1 hypothetical protein pEaSNUABM46_00132 [Erwinia phage pEa_SNUABM_46]QYW04457.1 hypothetical protein pEaSNUABM14_00132 [Erwinia phage pEa_SNUABM_14]QYW05146.1 hypothetical protein pEaSNU